MITSKLKSAYFSLRKKEHTVTLLKGEIRGTRRNAVLLNAGCAIYAANKAESIADGIKIAEEMIDSGRALEVLDQFVRVSNEEV